jgi:hypothetical protein
MSPRTPPSTARAASTSTSTTPTATSTTRSSPPPPGHRHQRRRPHHLRQGPDHRRLDQRRHDLRRPRRPGPPTPRRLRPDRGGVIRGDDGGSPSSSPVDRFTGGSFDSSAGGAVLALGGQRFRLGRHQPGRGGPPRRRHAQPPRRRAHQQRHLTVNTRPASTGPSSASTRTRPSTARAMIVLNLADGNTDYSDARLVTEAGVTATHGAAHTVRGKGRLTAPGQQRHHRRRPRGPGPPDLRRHRPVRQAARSGPTIPVPSPSSPPMSPAARSTARPGAPSCSRGGTNSMQA